MITHAGTLLLTQNIFHTIRHYIIQIKHLSPTQTSNRCYIILTVNKYHLQ